MNTCLICGHNLKKFAEIENYLILKCSYCVFGQTDKLDVQKGKYHRDEVYIEEEKLFKNIFQKRVDKILKFKKEGKVLEIGCSTGIMLSLLKNLGWEVVGVEISKKAAGVAAKRGIPVTVWDFMQTNLDEKYDLVILNHTLEHMDHPVRVLEKIKSLLSPSGLLYIDLPNFGGLSAKLLGTNWPLLLPDEHLWHFSEKSLLLLLKKIGFKVIFIEKASGIWDYGSPIGGVLLSLFSFKKRFFKEALTAVPAWVVSKLGLGSDLMVIARKT